MHRFQLIEKFAPIGLLAISCPLLIYASTLSAEVSCTQQVNPANPQQVIATPNARKTDLYPFFFLVALADGVLAGVIIRHILLEERQAAVAALPASDRPIVQLPETLPETQANSEGGEAASPLPAKRMIARLEAPEVAEVGTSQTSTAVSAVPQSIVFPPVNQPASLLTSQPATQPATTAQTKSVVRGLASSHLSIVFSAPPGSGKTTTELAWLGNLFAIHPDATVYIACWKNDAFLGLNKIPGAVAVLDGMDWSPLLMQINCVFAVLNQRRSLPKERRSEYQGKPVWLVLGDYYATQNLLSQNNKNKGIWDEVRTKLAAIITVGPEFLVGACVDTHSFNVAALGVSDGNIRDCLVINAIGKAAKEDSSRGDGGYGAIHKAINNKLIVDDDQLRTALLSRDLPLLQKRSDETGQPVMFTTLGHPPRLVLLPDLRQVESYRLPDHVLARISGNMQAHAIASTSESQDVRERLEGLFGASQDLPVVEQPKLISDTEEAMERALFLLIKAHMQSGRSKSWVIQHVLGCKGRKFDQGKEMLQSLFNKFGEEMED